MRGRLFRGAVVVLSLLAIPMLGCEAKRVQIQLDRFESSAIEGVFLHRQAPNGSFQRICEIRFGDRQTVVRKGEEVERIKYVQNCLGGQQGQPALMLETTVQHPADDPDAIVLDLWYLRFEDSGLYKASAFNAAGESVLSASSLQL
ncbi:hypothetical protein KJ059_02590 [Myxococcota bacterium]|nr:hypothetical protein [Myxococcota bacterium]MCZ7619773.1 hypothetical protein [Myxococcota bacterium]